MKPTPQASSHQQDQRGFPLTDYNYQTAVAEASATRSTVKAQPGVKMLPFHKLSSEFFGYERSRNYFAEVALFTFMTGLSAWPIIQAIIAVTRMVRGW